MSVTATDNAVPKQSCCELADIFRPYGPEHQRTHCLRPAQRKVLRAITGCRTPLLGGHREWCGRCGYERYRYHSCRNRHCPKCQTQQSADWVKARQQELLPVPYFHQVFTLPHDLNPLILFSQRNQRALLKLLFEAAAATLLEFGRRELGGQVGFTLVLHTWDQQLRPHFHLHGLIASGALAEDGSRWIAGGAKFLFPVHGLSKMFRAKYLDGLSRLLEQDQLDLPPQWEELSSESSRREQLRKWRQKSWVVYSKAPFAGPRKLIAYLGRYTHRVAISNHRLVCCRDGQVQFRYRDRRDGDRQKTRTLPAEEFLRRFLQHVLPDRFMRIRHYGLLANRHKQERLTRCRQLLGVRQHAADDTKSTTTLAEWLLEHLGLDIRRCPCCGSPLRCVELPPQPHLAVRPTSFASADAWDTS